MFDFNGDGDIDAFDEEMSEYEFQLMEDEIFFEELEGGRNKGSKKEVERGKSCGLGILMIIGFFIVVFVIIVKGENKIFE